MSNWSQLARQTLFDNSATAWMYGILAFLRGAQVSELLSRLGHIPLAGDLA